MSLHHAILGLLSTKPMTTDEVVRHFDQSIGQFWTAEHREVRRMLARVHEAGLASADPQPADDAVGETYRLTLRGRAVLRDWMISEPERYPNRAVFLLRLYFAASLDAGQVSDMLQARVDTVGEGLAMLKMMAAQAGQGTGQKLEADLALATVHNGIAHAQAEVDWALEWRDRIVARESGLAGVPSKPTRAAG